MANKKKEREKNEWEIIILLYLCFTD
jgi:hypothetical protein